MATLTDTIGRVLSGRYRVEAALGTGASAHVYLATDVSLKRRVAIKMLHPVLAADRSFLRRFRAEAQAAASLTHPNLVAVYDWGEDTDGPYLVLEYLGGGSLRNLLDDSEPLGHAHVATIGAQAAHGLAYAHARGFVHRDVKPANLLFDDDRRRLCVADFGLARALAEAAWTEPVGATLGTARYAAPEQAQGRRVDGRADVYALALVLYEALTGSVPFSADTTIGTLMARVGAPLPAHEALGPLDAIIKAGAAPEPEERLSAGELARRLSQVARELPAAGGLPAGRPSRAWRPYDDITEVGTLTGRNGAPGGGGGTGVGAGTGVRAGTGGANAPDSANTANAPDSANTADSANRRAGREADLEALALAAAIGVADEPPDTSVVAVTPAGQTTGASGSGSSVAMPVRAPRPDDITEIGASHIGSAQTGAVQTGAVQTGAVGVQDAGAHSGYGPTAREAVAGSVTHRRWPWILGLVLILLAGVGAAAVVTIRTNRVVVPTHKVPDLKGLTQPNAAAAVTRYHFRVRTTAHAYDVSAPVGTIISQDPHGGSRLRQGKTISVTTSAGPPPVRIPELSTITAGGCPAVTAVLAAAHLKAVCATSTSITVKAGGVIGYQPTTSALWGSAVRVVISSGLPQVKVPDLSGMSQTQAESTLTQAHFSAVIGQSEYSSTVPAGEPVAWTGEGSTLLYGSTVTIEMSLGHAPVVVPDVANGYFDVPQAEATLRADGFTIGGVYGPAGPISSTFPVAGKTEPFGTAVDIYTH